MTDRTIPIVEEQAEITKHRRTTGTVRVETTTREEVMPVDSEVRTQTVEVHRIPVNRFVDAPIPDRQDGDTLVISVIEEVLVVEKRLKVTEEIHLTRRTTTNTVHHDVPLRREEARVERR